MNFGNQKPSFWDKAKSGATGWKTAAQKANQKRKEWQTEAAVAADDVARSYRETKAKNKAMAQTNKLTENIKKTLGADVGGRRRRRKSRRKSRRGRRTRRRRRNSRRSRKKRTKRKRRRRR